MRIGLIGYGKMGRCIESVSHSFEVEIVSILKQSFETPIHVDAYIDFSNPKGTLHYLPILAKMKIPHVIGTTGWDAHLGEAKSIIEDEKSAAIYSPNFSLGVALFTQLLDFSSKLFAPFSDKYEKIGREVHSSKKKDIPSGTAKLLSTQFQIPFTSSRVGYVPGIHEVIFDSADDTLTINHTARSREGFAKGALLAAKWLQNKKGWFTFHDMLDSIYSSNHSVS